MSLRDQFGGAGSVPTAFPKGTPAGYVVHGTVKTVTVDQQREFNKADPKTPGDLLYYKDGKPIMQVVVTVDTGAIDPNVEDDEGLRRIYVKMNYKSDREALFAALDAVSADDIEVGGQFAAQFLGKLTNPDGTEQAWNTHKYEYKPPSKLGQAGLLGNDQPVPAAPQAQSPLTPQPMLPTPEPVAPVAPPAPVQQPAAPAPVVTPETATAVRGLIAAGMDDATISAAFPGVKRELIAALRNAAALAGS